MAQKTKADAQKNHARRRFNERYGIKLTQNVWDQILFQISSGSAVLIEKQSLRVKVYDVTINLSKNDVLGTVQPGKVRVRIVYDKLRSTIVTALPPDCIDIDNEGNY